jgi:hypothetical protein
MTLKWDQGSSRFDPAEFVLAGQLFEQDMHDYTCYGIVPTYETHPAYDKFMGYVKQLEGKVIWLLWYYQRMCKKVKHRSQARLWDGDADSNKY